MLRNGEILHLAKLVIHKLTLSKLNGHVIGTTNSANVRGSKLKMDSIAHTVAVGGDRTTVTLRLVGYYHPDRMIQWQCKEWSGWWYALLFQS